MLAAALTLLCLAQGTSIQRDAYGVPHVQAGSLEEAYFQAGYAVAEDRLWQMENSRRLARGKMAEVFGKAALESDKEVLRTGYSDDELRAQLDKLSPKVRAAYREYARGVNAYMDEAARKDELPKGYADNDFRPEPWTEVDSAAITVRLFQMFGRGGAGEVRNLALLTYLQSQPVKAKTLDVVDDLLWFQEPASPTTIRSEDASGMQPPDFHLPSRAETERHLAALPKFALFDLLPGLRLLDRRDSDMLAEKTASPFRLGSYAVVVSPKRSPFGPLLLGAPQMGFTMPSIVHEMSISYPGCAVVGMDIPGIPGIAIGHSDKIAWTVTSGIADTDDIYSFKDEGSTYLYGNDQKAFLSEFVPIKVKGEEDQKIERRRTMWGPVVVASPSAKAVLVRRSSYWARELETAEMFFELATAGTAQDVERAADKATMTFNFFYATNEGDIGYRYVGLVPSRPAGIDPRFPIVASPRTDWLGYIPTAKMPRIQNPKGGLITNWNNKPVAWWPNFDTPAWGRIFRVDALNRALPEGKITPQDLEVAAWTISRTDPSLPFFKPHLEKLVGKELGEADLGALQYLIHFDGRNFEGSPGASIYAQWLIALREVLFAKHVGTMLSPETFRLAIQPSVILNALEKRTRFDFLAGRTADEVMLAAYRKAHERLTGRDPNPGLWGYRPGTINYPNEAPVPYSDRGTYIQIVEVRKSPVGRNVLPPGVAEEGPHSRDQIPLARAWTYKPMRFKG
jgi:penicillin amidase